MLGYPRSLASTLGRTLLLTCSKGIDANVATCVDSPQLLLEGGRIVPSSRSLLVRPKGT